MQILENLKIKQADVLSPFVSESIIERNNIVDRITIAKIDVLILPRILLELKFLDNKSNWLKIMDKREGFEETITCITLFAHARHVW